MSVRVAAATIARNPAILRSRRILSSPWCKEIVAAGTGRTFQLEDNRRWLEVTRPMLEAFWHARFFVEMAVRYGRGLDVPPGRLPHRKRPLALGRPVVARTRNEAPGAEITRKRSLGVGRR
ncbi:MAG: hypothetical protein ACRDJN_25570, partial [Chloroflexota bacterium]